MKFYNAEEKQCRNCEHVGKQHWHEKRREETEYGACAEADCDCQQFEPVALAPPPKEAP